MYWNASLGIYSCSMYVTQLAVDLLSVDHKCFIYSSKRSQLYDSGYSLITGIISKLHESCYLVVCLFNSLCLISLNDIRAVFILNVSLHWLGGYGLL